MSWEQICENVRIKNLEVLKREAESLGLVWEDWNNALFGYPGLTPVGRLFDREGTGFNRRDAIVAEMNESTGTYKLIMDNDVNYSSIANRLGRNAAKLTRNYAAGMLTRAYKNKGCSVKRIELENGHLRLKIAVNG